MRFNPDDAQELTKLAEGDYSFIVDSAEDGIAQKSGNEMITLYLSVQIGNRNITIRDHLVNLPTCLYKIKHFAEAVGLLTEYENGELDANMMVDRSGTVHLKYGKPKQTSDGDRRFLEVADYVKPAKPFLLSPVDNAPPPTEADADAAKQEEEDIPF